MMGIIVVTGIPGVGKTTVMKRASDGMDIKFVTFGTVMVEIALELGLVKERDEMRKLNLMQQKELQIKSAEKVGNMGNVILDTHCTIKTPKGYLPGLPEWVIKRINPDTIVIVEADPIEIFNRRVNDSGRNRDQDNLEQINEHQMINRSVAMAYAALTGSTVKIIFNHDDGILEAVKQASPVLK
jgi:adenylate kinase